MARPSVKAERTEEILEAFERCVARLGIEGTTLERIAEESGLRRSLLRYHVGNRDKMVQALADRYIKNSREEARRFLAAMPSSNTSLALLDYFFTDTSDEERRRVLVAQALVSGVDLYPAIKEQMTQWHRNFVLVLCQVIRVDYPDASDADRNEVAWGIVSLLFNVQLLAALSSNEEFLSDGRRAADRLLKSLASDASEKSSATEVLLEEPF
ncbi:TetR/AcrR family transcriptional regulator [Pseudoteredinibacter isoporae]|uniref:TetR/AcrR family transcriptional regulator n=1 Tax=Pseudoteredinibacter isoporae TaxID=570281 RepID=UPI00310B6917